MNRTCSSTLFFSLRFVSREISLDVSLSSYLMVEWQYLSSLMTSKKTSINKWDYKLQIINKIFSSRSDIYIADMRTDRIRKSIDKRKTIEDGMTKKRKKEINFLRWDNFVVEVAFPIVWSFSNECDLIEIISLNIVVVIRWYVLSNLIERKNIVCLNKDRFFCSFTIFW